MNSQELRAIQEAYMEVYQDLDEGAAGDVAARAQKLANQKKGQTPKRKEMYQDLAYNARARQRTQDNPGDLVGASRFERSKAYGPQITPASSQRASETETIGGGTYERGSKRKPKGKKYKRQVQSGVRAASSQEKKRLGVGESYDLYDIILSHLLDEGYAETQEQAEVIMVNMSEDWRESIFEAEVLAQKGGVPGTVQMNKTREGGFLGIGSKEVSKPVPGSFKEKDVSSKDAARYNTGIDKKFGSADNIDNTSAANVQYAANRAGHSGYMKVKDPGSLPNTGIPNRPTPGRASDQNQARQMSGDIVRMNRR